MTNVLLNEEDQDIIFLPSTIIEYRKECVCRRVWKVADDDKAKLIVEKLNHMRVRAIWKNETISWCAAGSLRKQNPFVFIPYF